MVAAHKNHLAILMWSIGNELNASWMYGDCGFIEKLAYDGITADCSNNPPMFCPNNPVTRAEMAVFLVAVPDPLNQIL
jgi:hypothetical protein